MMLMILIGVVIELLHRPSETVKGIFIFVVINFAIPSVIIQGFFTNDFGRSQLSDLGVILSIAVCFNLLGLLISLFVYRMLGNSKDLTKQKTILSGVGNTGFIGIPIAFSIFGPIGGLYASFYDIGTILVVFSVGLMILQNDSKHLLQSLRRVINAPIITLVICLALTLTNIPAPHFIIELTGHLSGLTAPLAMFYIGFTIPQAYKIFKTNTFLKDAILPISLRLLLLPMLFISILSFLDLTDEVRKIIVLQTAMPSIILAPIFFKRYGYNEAFGSIVVIYITLLSMITIPLVAIISNLFVFK